MASTGDSSGNTRFFNGSFQIWLLDPFRRSSSEPVPVERPRIKKLAHFDPHVYRPYRFRSLRRKSSVQVCAEVGPESGCHVVGFNMSTLSNAEIAHRLHCGLSSVLEEYGARRVA